MSGEHELRIDSKLTEEINQTKQYLEKIKLKSIKVDPFIEKILGMDSGELHRLDQHVCFEYAFKLKSYSAFLQLEENEWNAILYWSEHNMKIIVGKYGRNYGDGYTSFEEKKGIVAVENSWASVLNKMILDAKLKTISLNMMSAKIHGLSTLLESLAHAKKIYNH